MVNNTNAFHQSGIAVRLPGCSVWAECIYLDKAAASGLRPGSK